MIQKNLWPGLLLFFVAIVLYIPTTGFELVYLDDNVWILDYGWLFQDWTYAARFFTGPDFLSRVFYRPVLNLTFLLDAHSPLPGFSGYRLTNLLLHAGCSCLVYQFFLSLKFRRLTSWLAGLVFAVHPASVAAVAWIPGRTDTLLAFFVLVAFLLYIRFSDHKKTGMDALNPVVQGYGAGHLVFFILALLSKETAIVLPVVCLVYTFFMHGRSGFCFRHAVMTGLWLGVTAGFLGVRHLVIPSDSRVGWATAAESLWQNAPSVISYLGKAGLPIGQSVLPHQPDMTLVWGWLVLGGLLVGLFLGRKANPGLVAFGAVWFLFFLLPSLVISFLKHEYRLYLPMIGIGIMAAAWVDASAGAGRKSIFRGILMGVIIMGLAVKTVVFSRNYQDRFVFWTNATRHSPTLPLAHRNLAAMYHLEGDFEKALAGYERALELNPREVMVNNNLGIIYQRHGDAARAERFYQSEIAVNPDYDDVYFNYGSLKYQLGQKTEARGLWEKTIMINPNYVDAWNSLLGLALEQGRREDARQLAGMMKVRGMELPPGL